VVGGVMDVLQMSFVRAVIERLGYPDYFLIILGVWKLLGAGAVVAPGLPRLKEWAYAGLIFNMTGALASHLAMGEGAETLVGPTIITGLAFTSWALRPPPPEATPLPTGSPPGSSLSSAEWEESWALCDSRRSSESWSTWATRPTS